MGQLTLTVDATTVVNGATHDLSGAITIPATRYSQQTKDLTDTFEQVTDSAFAYLVIVNVGDESLFVQLESTGPDYLPFEVVTGAHVVIPSSTDDGSTFSISRVNARSATSAGSRAIIITISAL